MAEDLQYRIHVTLSSYSQFVAQAVDKAAAASMRRFKERSVREAPVGRRMIARKADANRPHFFQSIASKKTVGTMAASVFVWYVKPPNYRLTHLIENGYTTKNGRSIPGSHFLRRILDDELPRYEAQIKEAIEHGN